ncbi:MAG: hypothetical protein M1831_006700 [Alyxoria varia]|nr:MAG: hypothetical protein M1831_006700 [Alyxoria varia]
MSLLEQLRAHSQVDIDAQSIQFASDYGPFVDCTSNQADAYNEMLEPSRAELLKQSARRAQEWKNDFPGVSVDELAVEIAMTSISLTVAPHVSGVIHVMANPVHSWSTGKLIENGQRISALCARLAPDFPLSRLVVKVPATWEGLQACRKLKALGVQTLATTVFTFVQCVLAGEAGCTYIAPFIHSLRSLFDDTYPDPDPPIAPLCALAQSNYKRNNHATRVKAAGCNGTAEVKQLIGVDSITMPPPLVEDALNDSASAAELEAGLFTELAVSQRRDSEKMERVSYIGDRGKWKSDFEKEEDGTGERKTREAIGLFSEYQYKAEELLAQVRLGA